MATVTRKAAHLRIAAEPGVLHHASAGLEGVRLRHRALPGRDLGDVELGIELLGRRLAAPLLVSAMTGGTDEAGVLNERLARAAAEHGVGMVLGSGRALLEDASLLRTYADPARDARPPLLLANLGVVGLEAEHGLRLVDLLGADGLCVHLNPLQEAVQPEGEPRFAGALERIAATAARLHPLPVVVKEVGFGLDREDVAALRDAGVAAVDVAGAGGTNWALVEGRRDTRAGAVAAAFADWGTPTAEAVLEARAIAPELPVIASGGVTDGVDVVKCLALGADAGALARPLLLAAREDRAAEALERLVAQVRVAVWACGAASAAEVDAERLR